MVYSQSVNQRTDNSMAKKKDKRTNKDLQNITHKTNDQITRTQLKTSGELRCSGMVGSSCSDIKGSKVVDSIDYGISMCTGCALPLFVELVIFVSSGFI